MREGMFMYGRVEGIRWGHGYGTFQICCAGSVWKSITNGFLTRNQRKYVQTEIRRFTVCAQLHWKSGGKSKHVNPPLVAVVLTACALSPTVSEMWRGHGVHLIVALQADDTLSSLGDNESMLQRDVSFAVLKTLFFMFAKNGRFI
jgi:hypothetical protein